MAKKIIFCTSLSLVILLGVVGAVSAQMTLESLMDKVQQISIEGKERIEILNEISQEGELDTSVPKRTITSEAGKRETIFVFDFKEEPDKAFQDLQNYFMKEEGFQVTEHQEEGGIKAVSLEKGTTKLLLVKKQNIVVEDRLEDLLLAPEALEKEEEEAAAQATEIPSWAWIVFLVVIVVVIVVAVLKKLLRKKK